MILGDILDKVSGVSSGLGTILDSTTKTAQNVKGAVTQGPTARPAIPTWLIWTLGIGGLVVFIGVMFKMAKG
jgi:hypothetical protein